MQCVRMWIVLVITAAFAVACADAPTAVTYPLSGAGVSRTEYVLPPIKVIGECDPLLSIDWCSGGGGTCASSTPAPGLADPMEATVMGCPGGDGGGTGSGSGGSGGTVSPPAAPTPFNEGPLAWAACVLAVLGATYSVDQVAGQFSDWWEAQRAYESAKRMLDAIYANPQGVSQETTALWEFRVEYQRDRVVAARSAVMDATNTSYWALGTAAVGCGAAAFLPTP
jgi:hypothetical protein